MSMEDFLRYRQRPQYLSQADMNSTAIHENNAPTIGGIPIWQMDKYGQNRRPGLGDDNKFPPPPGMLGKMGAWAGNHPLDAAKIAMNIWGGLNQMTALDQQQQYMDSVDKAMLFDQKDVDRRWNLAMGDYRVREEDQNQHRTAQGMENKKTNFTV